MINQFWILSAVVAALLSIGPARAESESRHWYVPWPNVYGGTSGSFSGSFGTIVVSNLSGEIAHVNVRAFDGNGQYLRGDYSNAFSLAAGASKSMVVTGNRGHQLAYLLVIASQPVLVRARERVVLQQVSCGNFAAGGNCDDYGKSWGSGPTMPVMIWNYTTFQPYPAYPIDCTNAAPNHFVCKQRLGGISSGPGDVGGPGPGRVERPADPAALPDLQVTSFNVTHLTVANTGNAPAGPFAISIDTLAAPIAEPGLAQGASVTRQITIRACAPGQGQIRATVDFQNQVAESNETNNTRPLGPVFC